MSRYVVNVKQLASHFGGGVFEGISPKYHVCTVHIFDLDDRRQRQLNRQHSEIELWCKNM